jgi:hypothetical protein
MIKRTGLFLAVALAATSNSFAQFPDPDSQIQLGGIQLQFGMTQEDALRKLAVVYNVKYLDNSPGNWAVTSRSGPPYRLVGTVVFGNEKLVAVDKSWGPDNQTARGLAAALSDALRATADAGRACTVSVEAIAVGSQTTIECGTHRIVVLAPQDANYSVGVSEIIRSGR